MLPATGIASLLAANPLCHPDGRLEMSTNTLIRLQNIKGGQWRIELRDRVEHLRSRLAAPAAALDPTLRKEAEEHLDHVYALINDRQTPAEWWSGSQVELAWTEMRLAEAAALRAERELSDIIGSGRATLEKAKGRLPDGHSSVSALTKELNTIDPPGPPPVGATGTLAQRLTVDVALACFGVSNAEHRLQRQTRNVLRLVVMILGILALVVAALGIWGDPLPGLVAAPEGLKTTGRAIAAALGLGAMGALFSAIPSLATSPANATTYNPRAEQAGLKIVVGAWSGLVGLVAVTAGEVNPSATSAASTGGSSPSSALTLAGFAVLCVGFGATQEALTRFADRKAADTKPTTT